MATMSLSFPFCSHNVMCLHFPERHLKLYYWKLEQIFFSLSFTKFLSFFTRTKSVEGYISLIQFTLFCYVVLHFILL